MLVQSQGNEVLHALSGWVGNLRRKWWVEWSLYAFSQAGYLIGNLSLRFLLLFASSMPYLAWLPLATNHFHGREKGLAVAPEVRRVLQCECCREVTSSKLAPVLVSDASFLTGAHADAMHGAARCATQLSMRLERDFALMRNASRSQGPGMSIGVISEAKGVSAWTCEHKQRGGTVPSVVCDKDVFDCRKLPTVRGVRQKDPVKKRGGGSHLAFNRYWQSVCSQWRTMCGQAAIKLRPGQHVSKQHRTHAIVKGAWSSWRDFRADRLHAWRSDRGLRALWFADARHHDQEGGASLHKKKMS